MPSARTLLHGSMVALLIAASTQYLPPSAQHAQQEVLGVHDVPDVCSSSTSPNPIAQEYPNLATGTINGTTVVIPISLETARRVIPSEYTIREDIYRSLLPSFPEGMYPMVATALHDHDLQFAAYNVSLPDFSRAALEFPFVDVLGDGRSSFRWTATMMISSSNEVAIKGSEGFGLTIHPSEFDPPCDAYKALEGGATYFHAGTTNSTTGAQSRFMTMNTYPSPKEVPYPMDFIKNVTNQVTFANTSICDNYIRHYDTPLTKGAHAPVPVRAAVAAQIEPFAGRPQEWTGFGWRFATAFTEPVVPGACESFVHS